MELNALESGLVRNFFGSLQKSNEFMHVREPLPWRAIRVGAPVSGPARRGVRISAPGRRPAIGRCPDALFGGQDGFDTRRGDSNI
jgi:hypothetical protein